MWKARETKALARQQQAANQRMGAAPSPSTPPGPRARALALAPPTPELTPALDQDLAQPEAWPEPQPRPSPSPGVLRRRLQQSTPYEDVLQSSEVERLRRELRELRATCAPNPNPYPNPNPNPNPNQVQHDEGLDSREQTDARLDYLHVPNLLVLSAGGYGHVAVS